MLHYSDGWLNIWVSGGHSGQVVATPAGPQRVPASAPCRGPSWMPLRCTMCGARVPLATGLVPWLSHTVQQLSGSCAPLLLLMTISYCCLYFLPFLRFSSNLIHLSATVVHVTSTLWKAALSEKLRLVRTQTQQDLPTERWLQ